MIVVELVLIGAAGLVTVFGLFLAGAILLDRIQEEND